MKRLELAVPPVLVFILSGILMVWLDSLNMTPIKVGDMTIAFKVHLSFVYAVFGGCFIGAAAFGLLGIYEFKKAKTSVHPVAVEKATTIVASGIFRFSRNPMYFGLFLLLFGFAYYQQNLLSMIVCVFFVLYMNHFQIKPEERFLETRFGGEYKNYKKRVRRWI